MSMGIFGRHTGLYTDFYEFTMAQGFFLSGKKDMPAGFDYFFRENPFHGGYVIFAGLDDLMDGLHQFRFDDEDIRFLAGAGLNKDFLAYLRGFRFEGRISAVREGEVVFPLEPVVRVEGNIIETQLIETLLLNLLNFESLIATKASRIRAIAGERRVVDFGLRRAQGLGGIQATKAAVIGGFDATSHVYAAFRYSLEVSGTQAHSWVQSFDDELSAFRKFAETFPDKCVLLVDTYNTLKSGIPNAIIVAKELEKKGHKLVGIRLDSGDLAYLSKHARAMLDQAGLSYVRIVASNQLDEYVIRSLLEQGAPIDAFGVGTRLVTGQNSSALDGVYKLSDADGKPRLKFSENFAKITLPGRKTVLRYFDSDGMFYADGVILEGEKNVETIYHPFFPENRSNVRGLKSEGILLKVMEGGKRLAEWTIEDSSSTVRKRLAALSPEHKRFENPHVYKVGISGGLLELRSTLVDEFHKKM
ncbi:MAG TPA: nicotinate phosphoribosyltransferase [Bacteroidota bacterium]|nr:nicotinate phosphoribosyltransferase [Bacteroidota bacterium]